MVFCIFVEVTIPVSSCRIPRSALLCSTAPAASFAITPSSIQFRAVPSLFARNRALLPAAFSILRPVRSKAENAAGKSARRARPAGSRARLCSSRGTSPCDSRYVPPLQFLRPADKLRPDGQFVRSQLHRFRCRHQVHAGHFEHHSPRLYHRHPLLRWTFALTHTSLGRLLGIRLVRENPDPQFSATLDESRNRHARRFNLSVRNPGRFQCLQPVLTKRQRSTAPRLASPSPALLLAVLYFFRHQHKFLPVSLIFKRYAFAAAAAAFLFTRCGIFSPW